jgi:hypothetical protein
VGQIRNRLRQRRGERLHDMLEIGGTLHRRQRISRARPARNLCRYGADDAPETGNPEGVSAVSSRTMTRPSPSAVIACRGITSPSTNGSGPALPTRRATSPRTSRACRETGCRRWPRSSGPMSAPA